MGLGMALLRRRGRWRPRHKEFLMPALGCGRCRKAGPSRRSRAALSRATHRM